MTRYVIATLVGIIGGVSVYLASAKIQNYFHRGDGGRYAALRIAVGEEEEGKHYQGHSEKLHAIDVIQNPTVDHLKIMREYLKIYVTDGNLAGIRGLFLEAYVLASVPCRSGDILASYGDPIKELINKMGDAKFVTCLEKMRPEVQSAVFYLLNYTYWPLPGRDPEWDERFTSVNPRTFELGKKVVRLKWPSDYEE